MGSERHSPTLDPGSRLHPMRTSRLLLSCSLAGLAAPALQAQGCPTLDTPIWAAQTIRAGDVDVNNSQEHLRMDCRSLFGWKIREVHIYVGFDPVPTNAGGNVSPGGFPYKTSYDPPVTRHIQMVSLSDFPARCGDLLYMAGHFDLVQLDPVTGAVIAEETGWAHGKIPFTGSQWGWQNTYVVCCDSASCQGTTGLTLTSSAVKRGQPLTLTLTGAVAGERALFLANTGAVACGAGKRLGSGVVLDLFGRARLLGVATADAGGTAMLTTTVPAGFPRDWAGFQALVPRPPTAGLSNPLVAPVLP